MKAKPGKIISQIAIWLVFFYLRLAACCRFKYGCDLLSGSDAVAANKVGLWPVDFTITTYNKLLGDSQFWHSFWIFSKESSNWYFNQYVFYNLYGISAF